MKFSDVHDAQIISETTTQKPDIPTWLLTLADTLTTNDKGKLLTNFLVNQQLVKSPQQIQTIYQQNAAGINSYLDQIDLVKLSQALSGNVIQHIKKSALQYAKENIPGLIIGTIAGVTVASVIHSFRH